METSTTMETGLLKAAEIELVYRTTVKASDRPVVTTSKQAYSILLNSWDQNKIEMVEQFKVILLNRGNKVLGIYENSTGGIHETVADVRLILTAALKANAVKIMLAHNHPSSNLKPSQADRQLTHQIIQASGFLNIQVLDHLIICNEGYYSFADEGLL